MNCAQIAPAEEPVVAIPVLPFRIEFRPRGGDPGKTRVLVSCADADVCRAQLEPCARQLLDQRRSGEVHLVEAATGRSLALRPVWPAGETPLPEWVAWHRYTLQSAR